MRATHSLQIQTSTMAPVLGSLTRRLAANTLWVNLS